MALAHSGSVARTALQEPVSTAPAATRGATVGAEPLPGRHPRASSGRAAKQGRSRRGRACWRTPRGRRWAVPRGPPRGGLDGASRPRAQRPAAPSAAWLRSGITRVAIRRARPSPSVRAVPCNTAGDPRPRRLPATGPSPGSAPAGSARPRRGPASRAAGARPAGQAPRLCLRLEAPAPGVPTVRALRDGRRPVVPALSDGDRRTPRAPSLATLPSRPARSGAARASGPVPLPRRSCGTCHMTAASVRCLGRGSSSEQREGSVASSRGADAGPRTRSAVGAQDHHADRNGWARRGGMRPRAEHVGRTARSRSPHHPA